MPAVAPASPTDPARIVVAGASGADGFRQLVDFVAALPADLPAAVLVVLHRPPDRLSQLPGILARSSQMPIVIPKSGEPMQAGRCYVADADHHLAIGPNGRLRLVSDHSYRNRTIDLLFSTAAKEAEERVIGVVLAGSLRDGSKGLADIARAGGAAFVIDSVWTQREGMPRAASIAVPGASREDSAKSLAQAVARIARSGSGTLPRL